MPVFKLIKNLMLEMTNQFSSFANSRIPGKQILSKYRWPWKLSQIRKYENQQTLKKFQTYFECMVQLYKCEDISAQCLLHFFIFCVVISSCCFQKVVHTINLFLLFPLTSKKELYCLDINCGQLHSAHQMFQTPFLRYDSYININLIFSTIC